MAHLIELMQAKHLLTAFLFGSLLLASTNPCVAQGDLRAGSVARAVAVKERERAINTYCREASVGAQKKYTVGFLELASDGAMSSALIRVWDDDKVSYRVRLHPSSRDTIGPDNCALGVPIMLSAFRGSLISFVMSSSRQLCI